MAIEWKEVQAQDLFERLPVGRRYDQWSVQPSGSVPVLDQSPGGVFGFHNDAPGIVASPESPIVTFSNHRCYVRLIKHPFSVIQNVFPLRARNGVDPYFMFQALRRSVPVTEYKGHWDDFSRMVVCLPPLPEQRAIALILGALDDKIELNRRMNETLEEMARTIFKSWFVDFDPVKAKAEGRQPEGMDSETAALFPSRFVNSELGMIPEGWEAGALGDVVRFLGGYSFKSSDWTEAGVPVVKIGSVKPGIVDLSAVSFVNEQVANEASRYQLATGDLLIGMTGYVGEVGLVPPSDNPPLLNQRVGKLIPTSGSFDAVPFVYCLTRRSEFKTAVELRAHGTAQANVSGQAILSVPIVVPTTEVRGCFDRTHRPAIERMLANHAENRTLAALRDSLLPKLISGELRIPDAEKLAEADL